MKNYIESTGAPIACAHVDVALIEFNCTDYVEIMVIGTDVYYTTKLLSGDMIDSLRKHLSSYGKIHSAFRYQKLFESLLNAIVESLYSSDYGMATITNRKAYPDGITVVLQIDEHSLQQLKLVDKLSGCISDANKYI